MKRFTGSLRVCRVLALLFLFSPRLLSQDSPPTQNPSQPLPQPPPTTVRVTTHLVQVGVIVRDNNGPISNLTKDDFTLLDRGKTQNISIFSAESAHSPSQSTEPLPPNTFSDLPQYGAARPRSVTIVLLDNLNTLTGSTPAPYEDTPFWMEDHALAIAKLHLLEFLKQLDPSDRIAIYGLTDKVHVLCDFTCDRDQLLAVVAKYDATSRTQRDAEEPGTYHFPQPADNQRRMDVQVNADVQEMASLKNQARAQVTMAALMAIAAHLADIPGRKNLLWLTANLPFSGEAIARILGPSNIAAYPVDARGLLPRAPQGNISGVMDADAYATGALSAPPAMSSEPTGLDAMQQMADDTGGRAFVNTNDLTAAIRKVVEDSAVTYTLGFYVDARSLDGKFHDLRVQVKRPGLTVRYPKRYFASKDTPATEDERHNNFLVAIKSPLDSSAISLRVKIDRIDHPPSHSLQILGAVDLQNLRLVQVGASRVGSFDVYIIEQDTAGTVLRQTNNRLRLKLTDHQYESYLQSGISFRESIEPNPQTSLFRVVVQDPATSQTGSIIIPLAEVK